MNPSLEKTSSSVAVLERRPKRPAGCVGIFFQLFDWNRRFAKNKLFSKKLLPPVRLKQSAKKFGGKEKQGKIRLIADENSGGFPNAKNGKRGSNCEVDHQKQEIRAPGLVARLMGLESMPALQRDKSRKAASLVSGKGEKLVDLNVEKGRRVKHELRPPKLQKTSVSERQPVARFGAEKLPFKNVLSKSKRHHHPKLPTPVKSPRSLSRKSSSRLIGAATRILEPGLQASRSKSALTYSYSSRHPARNDAIDERAHTSPNRSEDLEVFVDSVEEELQQCRNCGYLPNYSDSKQLVFVSPPNQRNKLVHSEFCRPYEEKMFEESPTPPTTIIDHLEPPVEVKCPSRKQAYRHSRSQPCNISPSSDNKMLHSRVMAPHGSKLNDPRSNKVSKATVTTVNGSTRLWVPVPRDNSKIHSERRNANRLNDSVPLGRKRRPINIPRYGEGSACSSSSVDNQTFTFRHSSISRKQPGYSVSSYNRRSELLHLQGETKNSGRMDNNAYSFTFSSPSKLKIGSRQFSEEKVKNGENSRRKKIEISPPISGDALGALLEQKLKELNCQGEDTGGNAPKKTTAMILHELISALTSEIPLKQDNSATTSYDRYNCLSCSTSPAASLGNEMAAMCSVHQPVESDHLSPGSVLEAYLSNESCLSCSSVGDCHGYNSQYVGCSHSRPQFSNPDSIRMLKSSRESVMDILNNVSEILSSSSIACFGLKGSKLDRVKEVLLSTELVFHNEALSIKNLLLHELETVASVLWINFGCSFGNEDGREEEVNQMTRFTVDLIIEYLGLRFEEYRISNKFPLEVNTNMLVFEMVEVVRRWEKMSRFNVDELVEREMGLSAGEWSRCEAERFEAAVEISRDLYQNVVDEIVTDVLNFG